jgi:hypothetical protein
MLYTPSKYSSFAESLVGYILVIQMIWLCLYGNRTWSGTSMGSSITPSATANQISESKNILRWCVMKKEYGIDAMRKKFKKEELDRCRVV